MKAFVLRNCWVLLLFLSIVCTIEVNAEENLTSNRPGPENKPTEVKIGVIVLDIENIEGATQTFTANVFMKLQWEDPRLIDAAKGKRTLKLTDV